MSNPTRVVRLNEITELHSDGHTVILHARDAGGSLKLELSADAAKTLATGLEDLSASVKVRDDTSFEGVTALVVAGVAVGSNESDVVLSLEDSSGKLHTFLFESLPGSSSQAHLAVEAGQALLVESIQPGSFTKN